MDISATRLITIKFIASISAVQADIVIPSMTVDRAVVASSEERMAASSRATEIMVRAAALGGELGRKVDSYTRRFGRKIERYGWDGDGLGGQRWR